jgi:rubrerythrin
MSSEKIVSFLKRMIKIEERIVESVNDSLVTIENYAVESALKGISLDSMKHAEMYRSALVLMTKKRLPLNQEQFDDQRELISRHIKMEEEMMERLDEAMPMIEDDRVSFLLEAIMSDERRHHRVLKKLHKVLVRGESIIEEDWWDAIWKDVPGLWT